jgi:CDGSH-type Zn-finger protein
VVVRTEVTIVPYRDGPYLVRGPVVLHDQDGRDIVSRRPTVALCRCGKSRMRPFCDGTHQLIRFQAPSEQEDRVRETTRSRQADRERLAAVELSSVQVTPASDQEMADRLGWVEEALVRARQMLPARGAGGDGRYDDQRARLVAELRAAADLLERSR